MKIKIKLIVLLTLLFSCNKKVKKTTSLVTKAIEIKDTVAIKKEAVKRPKDTVGISKVTTPILGIDVSHFQGDVDWEKVKASGIQFCYAKATQGKHYKDPKFQENKLNTKKAKITHGAYHFYVAQDDPKLQAQNFLGVLSKKAKNDMLPMLDLEQGGIKQAITSKKIQKDVLIWLNEIEKVLGVKPIIYTNNPFAKKYLQNEIFASYKLWLAEYGVSKPRVPSPWKDWTIWQRSEKGFVSGAKGNIDHDIVNSKIGLKELQYSN